MPTLEEDFKKYETSYVQYYRENYNKALRNLKNTKNGWNDNSLTISKRTFGRVQF